MPYRLFIIFFCFSFLPGQSLFNRFVGTDPFKGYARSTAMGNTHLLNSTGSANVRFNPANITSMEMNWGFDIQADRSSVFERWSMPTKNKFGDFLTNADYVANEFNYHSISSGLFASINLPIIGTVGAGFHYAPLTHFIYHYSEEVRARMNGIYEDEWRDDEIPIKDPYIGSHNLDIEGSPMVTSLGCGIQLDMLGDIDFYIGGTINLIQSTQITNRVEVDTINTDDVTNLSTLHDVNATSELPSVNFMTFSTTMNLNSNIFLGASWEEKAKATTTPYSLSINSMSGLFQYFDDSSYVVNGLNYMKPEISSLALSYISHTEQTMSINFEINQVSYDNHLNLQNYRIFKFGFEYLTQMRTPIRGGLVYKTASIHALKPVSMFTFGTGKTIGNLVIDAAGTYCFQSFYYPDLFLVEDDIRPDYDLVRESQFHLQLDLSYKF